MKFTRRDFVKLSATAAAGGMFAAPLGQITQALAAAQPATPLVWVGGNGPHVNYLSMLGSHLPGFLELVSYHWQLRGADHLAFAAGEEEELSFSVAPVLIMEAIPFREDLKKARLRWLEELLSQSKAAIFLGSEACFGGVLTPKEEMRWFNRLCREHKTTVINLPGVPVAPHHLVGTLGHLQWVGLPELDGFRRPKMYYGQLVCDGCERRGDLENGHFAQQWGRPGCLLKLGCKGPITHNSCAVHKWNGGENWCVGAGGPCVGCSDPGYPDHGGLGLYGRLPGDKTGMHSAALQNLDTMGWGLLGLAGTGAALQFLRRYMQEGLKEGEDK